MSENTRELARFACQTKFEDIPPHIVTETKHVIMDSIGCALGALSTDKGKIMAALGRRYGGPEESSIIGLGDKVSCNAAALTNGELMITLDYHDIIAGGHDGVYVLPTVLAIAETVDASGKDLILATAIGLEISARVARAVGRHNITPDDVRRQANAQRGLTGNAYSNFGAAAGAGRLLDLDEERMLNAIGAAGHLTMVLSYGRWGAGGHGYMSKYGVPGWQSTGAVTAALLAEMGYTGDKTVLDDPQRGFHYYVGYPNWYPEVITEGLGKTWILDSRLHYKPYPCCGVFHSALDCFYDIINENNLTAEEIEEVVIYGRGSMPTPGRDGTRPAVVEIPGIGAAQFNLPYNIAVAAHRVPIGVEWLDPDTMKDPEILAFMDRVVTKGDPDYGRRYEEELEKNPLAALAKVEVSARGQKFVVERTLRRGTTGTEAAATEEDLTGKFAHNAARVLTRRKTKNAIEALVGLEKVENISRLMKNVTL